MRIVDNRLEGARFEKATGQSGALINPSLIVMHYTASGGATGAGDAGFFAKLDTKAGAHFIIGRDGTVIQCVDINRRAWHAGVSIWRGKPNVNDFSIGIEMDNYGWLTKMGDGTFRGANGRGDVVPADRVIEARHKNTATPYKYWEAYTEAQMKAAVELCKALKVALPSIKEIVGHEDIAPGRKTDPGPAFNTSNFASQVFGRDDSVEVVRVVNASSLKVRGGPGVQHSHISSLPRGSKVTVLYDAGEWSQIEWGPNRESGWVADQYLS